MKSLQRLFTVVVLTFTFTLPAFAGDMDCPIVQPPPRSSVMDGGMGTPLVTDEASDEATSLSPGAEMGLSLLQSVLALF